MNKYQQGRSIIGMLFLSIIACFLSYIGVIKLRVFLMDWEADRLCAKEGGIHIYEKAYLPGGYAYNWTANEKIFRRSFGCSNPDEHAPYAIGGTEIPIGRSANQRYTR